MFIGASYGADGMSSPSNLLHGKVKSKRILDLFSSKTLKTQSLIMFGCGQNLVKEVLHDVGPIEPGHNTLRDVMARRYHLYAEFCECQYVYHLFTAMFAESHGCYRYLR